MNTRLLNTLAGDRSCRTHVLLLLVVIMILPSMSMAESCAEFCDVPVVVSVPSHEPDPDDPNQRPRWISTGVFVQAGETLCIETSGQVNDGGGYVAGPNGTSFCGDPNPNYPDWYNDIAHICLIGRLRLDSDSTAVMRLDDGIDGDQCDGEGFLWGPGHVGGSFSMVSSDTGWIELAVNDGDTFNNSGAFIASICVLSDATATQSVTWGRVKSLYR